MKRLFSLLFISLFTFTCHASGDIMVMDAWSPEAPPVAPVLAGYMMLHNHGETDQSIVGAESNAFKKVEIHRSEMKDNQVRMVKQKELVIAADQMVALEPGGTHLMLFEPRQAFKKGDHIPVTLNLKNGHKLKIELTVKEQAGEEHHHHHH